MTKQEENKKPKSNLETYFTCCHTT